MDRSLRMEPWVTREPYDSVFRAIFLLNAAIIAALALGFGIAGIVDSNNSALQQLGSVVGMTLGIAVAYGLWRADLELRINDNTVSARAWPFRSVVVPIAQVVGSEVVEIDPLRDYRGWGIKGSRQDKLIGGKGTTAIRSTYIHESGEKRKLTFLTEQAAEAERQIDHARNPFTV